jgi:hypothetical protein
LQKFSVNFASNASGRTNFELARTTNLEHYTDPFQWRDVFDAFVSPVHSFIAFLFGLEQKEEVIALVYVLDFVKKDNNEFIVFIRTLLCNP